MGSTSTVRVRPGHWMTAVPGDPQPGAHFVPIGAENVPYVHGASYIAPACRAQCVPAGQEYLDRLRVCPECRKANPNAPVCCTSTSERSAIASRRASSTPAAPSAPAERPEPGGGRASTSAGTGGQVPAPVPAGDPR
jgi:hypothetical protein